MKIVIQGGGNEDQPIAAVDMATTTDKDFAQDIVDALAARYPGQWFRFVTPGSRRWRRYSRNPEYYPERAR